MVSIFFIALIVSILQLTAITYARNGVYTFDLQLIILAFFSLNKGFKVGIALGVFFGIFNCLFGISPFWLNIFLYCLTGFIIGYIGQWLYKESVLTFIVIVFCSMAFIYFSKVQLNILDYTFRLFLPAASCNILASFFLFYFLRRVYPVRNTEYK